MLEEALLCSKSNPIHTIFTNCAPFIHSISTPYPFPYGFPLHWRALPETMDLYRIRCMCVYYPGTYIWSHFTTESQGWDIKYKTYKMQFQVTCATSKCKPIRFKFCMRGFPITAQYPTKGSSKISIFNFSHVRYWHPNLYRHETFSILWDNNLMSPKKIGWKLKQIFLENDVLVTSCVTWF